MPKLIAINIIEKIIHDLTDRRGLQGEWYNIDEDIQKEIIETWQNIASDEIIKSQNIKINRDEQLKELKIWKEQKIEQAVKAIENVFDEEWDKLGK